MCTIDITMPSLIFSGPADFTTVSVPLLFNTGSMFTLSNCISIPTVNDFILEGDHDFSVQVTSIDPPGAVTATPDTFGITIRDAADGGLLLHHV